MVTRSPAVPIQTTPATITHILNRLSLGPRPGDRSHIQSIGIDAYIQSQLNPDTLDEPSALTQRLQNLKTQTTPALRLFEQHQSTQANGGSTRKEQQQDLRHDIVKEATQARLLKAIASPRQLQEVMVDFWFNHFNVYAYKNFVSLWLGSYERDAIRPHALGKFRTLLGSVAKHPAMLRYLDNWRNTDPNSPGARGIYKGLNENYARELMELHTLGVDGGYTQRDVEALARILTGWSVIDDQYPNGSDPKHPGFVFVRDRHDHRNKQLLGTSIPGEGIEEGETALDILARHPSTARFISYKLAQYFVADDPPTGLVQDLASQFQSTDGHIAAVLQTLLEHPQFWNQDHRKFRTPYQYVLAIARAIGLTNPQSLRPLKNGMGTLGLRLYNVRPPNGYSNTQDTWLSPDAMLRRIGVAQSLAYQYRNQVSTIDTLMNTVSHQLPSSTQTTIRSARKHLQPALLLASSEMMYY